METLELPTDLTDHPTAGERDMKEDIASGGQGNSENEDEATQLENLTEGIRDQDELERNVALQADRLLIEQADKKDQHRIDRVIAEKEKLRAQERKLQQRLSQPSGSSTSLRIQAEVDNVRNKISSLDEDIAQIEQRIEERHAHDDGIGETLVEGHGNRRMPHESQRDFLIRTGKITPFAKVAGPVQRSGSTLQDAMLDAEEGEDDGHEAETLSALPETAPLSHQNLRMPGFMEEGLTDDDSTAESSDRATKRRRLLKSSDARNADAAHAAGEDESASRKVRSESEAMSESSFDLESKKGPLTSEDEVVSPDTSDVADEYSLRGATRQKHKVAHKTKAPKPETDVPKHEDLSGLDDGNEKLYQARLRSWVKRRSQARAKAKAKRAAKLHGGGDDSEDGSDLDDASDEEWYLPHPTQPDVEIKEGFHIPGDIYPSLFEYQKTGVQWLCELYSQQTGGIIGDEMGLGKTIQVISFLAGLHYSKKLTKPVIVVTPATVMKQWVNEFRRWWPPLRVSILHTSGSGMLNVRGEDRVEREIEEIENFRDPHRARPSKSNDGAGRIVETVLNHGHVLVTTYAGLQTYANLLIPVNWDYAVLDEGHKIRNPNAGITIYCKELRTANRVILSGTPMQNNLTELWSLFDFVFPMRLGTLLNFKQQFDVPIRMGGYANASNLEVQTAIECAARLKDAISPFLLQRLKVDVAADLPKKSEQVLFCKLTKSQRQAYEDYLNSADVKAIMGGQLRSFSGIEKLRKICNHPDLVDREILKRKPNYHYGSPTKSGKMQVVKALLEVWRRDGHKTLLFAQQKIVLDILEKFINSLGGFKYRRMDGDSQIEHRQGLVDEFNHSPDLHVFLLTTKVGGLGVNLTGADRVIIFDPDWNPSTDTQARERAWRLGQKREVTIYRLMTAGTIEEKIYHRQLFKQFLANKILKDPNQRQAFPMKDLHDLFTFGGEDGEVTETGEMFKGTETKLVNGDSHDSDGNARASKDDVGKRQPDQSDTAQIRDMAGIACFEEFAEPESDKASVNDKRIMEGILAGSGVHSALEHDDIVNGKRTKGVQADPETTRRNAQKYAAKAAAELMRAGEVARTVPVGTPTWTGTHGVTGRPDSGSAGRGAGRGSGRAGPSSSGVLERLQNGTGAGASASSRNSPAPGPDLDAKGFMKLIRDFILVHGGQVQSQMLVDHFNRLCQTPVQIEQFKAVLKRIATLEQAGRMRGRWVMKDEFK